MSSWLPGCRDHGPRLALLLGLVAAQPHPPHPSANAQQVGPTEPSLSPELHTCRALTPRQSDGAWMFPAPTASPWEIRSSLMTISPPALPSSLQAPLPEALSHDPRLPCLQLSNAHTSAFSNSKSTHHWARRKPLLSAVRCSPKHLHLQHLIHEASPCNNNHAQFTDEKTEAQSERG